MEKLDQILEKYIRNEKLPLHNAAFVAFDKDGALTTPPPPPVPGALHADNFGQGTPCTRPHVAARMSPAPSQSRSTQSFGSHR